MRLTIAGTLLYAVSNTVRQLRAGQGAFTWLESLLLYWHADSEYQFVSCMSASAARAYWAADCLIWQILLGLHFLIHCAARDHIDLFIPQTLPVYAFFRPLLIIFISVLLSICIAFARKMDFACKMSGCISVSCTKATPKSGWSSLDADERGRSTMLVVFIRFVCVHYGLA